MSQSKNKKFNVLNIIGLAAAVTGVIISALLIKEDVLSTKITLLTYFPEKFGVTPASTESGGAMLGWFTTVLQVVTAFISGNKKMSGGTRFLSFMVFLAACAFDNWTDVVFRSGNLSGDVFVSVVTTLAFYTFGSELSQALAWIVIGNCWREAVSETMWLFANVSSGLSTIGREYENIKRHAQEREEKERNITPLALPKHKPQRMQSFQQMPANYNSSNPRHVNGNNGGVKTSVPPFQRKDRDIFGGFG